jgi:hypothetical protein
VDMAVEGTRAAVSVTIVTEHPIPMLITDQGAEANSSAATAIFKGRLGAQFQRPPLLEQKDCWRTRDHCLMEAKEEQTVTGMKKLSVARCSHDLLP